MPEIGQWRRLRSPVSSLSFLSSLSAVAAVVLQWCPRDPLAAPISSAVYSCDGQLIYAGFCDGAVGVLDAGGLRLRCRVAPSAYLAAPPVPW